MANPYRFAKLLASAAVMASLSGSLLAQKAYFDAETNMLSLDSLSVSGQYFGGVGVALPPGQSWSIVGNPRLTSPLTAGIDTAIYSGAQLHLPRFQVGGVVYSGTVLNLPVGGAWGLVTMGSVLSAASVGYDNISFPIRTRIKNSYETDSGGELTYPLVNGQVWKHVIDEPCMPPGIGTADPDGYSDVEIYPNPGVSGAAATNEGNFRFVTYYPNKQAATLVETCIVGPVSVPGLNGTSSMGTLSVSQPAVSGPIGSRRSVYVTGGTPPYYVVTDIPGVADFWLAPGNAANGQELIIAIRAAASANLTIYDFNRVSTTVAVEPVDVAFSMVPSSIDATAGSEWSVAFFGGVPPYRLYHNPSNGSVQIGGISMPTASEPARVTVKLVRSPGDLEMPIVFADSLNNLVVLTVKVKQGTTPGSGGSIFK